MLSGLIFHGFVRVPLTKHVIMKNILQYNRRVEAQYPNKIGFYLFNQLSSKTEHTFAYKVLTSNKIDHVSGARHHDICLFRSWFYIGIGSFLTSVTISISISRIFRSWVPIYQLRPPMVSLSHSVYDMPGFAPRMNVLFWGRQDFQIIFSNRDTSRNAWYHHWRSFMVDMGIISNNTKFLFHQLRNECLFFSVHGKWIAVRNKQIAWTAKRFSCDLFVPHCDLFPMNREKKTLIPYIYNASNKDPF